MPRSTLTTEEKRAALKRRSALHGINTPTSRSRAALPAASQPHQSAVVTPSPLPFTSIPTAGQIAAFSNTVAGTMIHAAQTTLAALSTAQSAPATPAAINELAEATATAFDAATVADASARGAKNANLQIVVRDSVRTILSDTAITDKAQAIADRVVYEARTILSDTAITDKAQAIADRVVYEARTVVVDESVLAARRAAAIVGAFQALEKSSSSQAVREQVALEIMNATMPKKWRDAITKSPEQRVLPFASKVVKAGVVMATLTGVLAVAGAALPIMWLAPVLFLPPVATRMVSAVHDLLRGVPTEKRKEEIEALVRGTLSASDHVRPSELVGQMAAALVAAIQKTNVGLDKTWLKKLAIASAPKVHSEAVKAEVNKVTPGRFATGLNYWLGTNLGGKRSHIR